MRPISNLQDGIGNCEPRLALKGMIPVPPTSLITEVVSRRIRGGWKWEYIAMGVYENRRLIFSVQFSAAVHIEFL